MDSSTDNSQQLNYSSLIKKVGDQGCYQWIVFVFVFFCAFCGGFTSSSISLLFLNPGFDCSALSISEIQCQSHICSNIAPEERYLYEAEAEMNTLVTQFGPFHCEQNYGISLLRSLIYLGCLVSFFPLTWYTNNISRKRGLLICLAFCVIGSFIMVLAHSLLVAMMGIFFIGMGYYAGPRFGTALLSEVTERLLGQNFVALVVLAFPLGSILSSLAYDFTKDWRLVVLFFNLIPFCILILVCLFFIVDSPKMLLRSQEADRACAQLNKIGITNRVDYEITREQIIKYILEEERFEQNISILDFCRYPSVRLVSILFFLATAIIDFIFYSHFAISDIFGVNPVLNQLSMSIADSLGCLLMQFSIRIAPRTKTTLSLYSLSVLLTVITLFIQVPANCEGCESSLIQLGLVLIVRMAINAQFSLFFVHQAQFYPISIRTLGFGIGGFFGAAAQGINQIIMVDSQEWGINPFIIILLSEIILTLLYFFIPETLNTQPKDQIEEVQVQNINQKKKFMISSLKY